MPADSDGEETDAVKDRRFPVHFFTPLSAFPSHEARPTTPCDHIHFPLPNLNSSSLDPGGDYKTTGSTLKKRDLLSDARMNVEGSNQPRDLPLSQANDDRASRRASAQDLAPLSERPEDESTIAMSTSRACV